MNTELRRDFRRSVAVWGALLVLLLLTFGSAFLRLGPWNGVLNLAIAAIKALLVATFFMHLRNAGALHRLAAAVPLLALALLFGLSHADYATRPMQPAPWQTPAAERGAQAAGRH
jgi:cytochrome c oxidase subunit 4